MERVTAAVYTLCGLLAGMVEASRLMTGQPTARRTYELQAIIGAVIILAVAADELRKRKLGGAGPHLRVDFSANVKLR